MAAAEYFNPGATAQGPPLAPHQAPFQAPQSQLHPNGLPYPISDAPPPYSARPNSQPPPQQRPVQNGYQSQQSPYPMNQQPPSGYPPSKANEAQGYHQSTYGPSGYTAPYPPPQQLPQQNGFYQQPGASMSQVYGPGTPGRRPSSTPAYVQQQQQQQQDFGQYSGSRDRSRSRRRHHHHHHHDNNNDHLRPQLQRKKSSGVSTFLGAGGGAIVGDLIFPGLGTLGGAILGGVGGHEYGKKNRARSNPGRLSSKSYSYGSGNYDEYDHGRGRKY